MGLNPPAPRNPAVSAHARRASQPRARYRSSPSVAWVRSDWVIIALPTVLATRNLYSGPPSLAVTAAFACVVGLLVVSAFARSNQGTFVNQFGPLILLIAASTLVIVRSSGLYNLLVYILISALAIHLAKTVDARRIIGSLIDGIGLYSLVNVLAYAAGLRSVTESEGLRLSLNSGGVNRIIFPLEHSLNMPPVLAAMYLAAVVFLIREPGLRKRIFRIACFIAAVAIIVGSGTRVPAIAAVTLPIMVVFLPTASRGIAPALAVLASFSAVILPSIISSVQFVLNPVVSLLTDRRDTQQSLAALNGRDYVWGNSLEYFRDSVNDPFHILFGYGMQGHYKSGASLTYYNLLDHVFTRDPEKIISMHNSFLQQLFDGGLVGWALLVASLFWVGMRYSRRLHHWGPYSVAATMALSVLLLCSTTEILLHPSVMTFWLMLILAGAACQQAPNEHQVESGET